MDKTVIVWKLNEVMAQKRIRNKDLAGALGISENSVYRLRKTDEMPRLSPERLNGICLVLECQPGDLLLFVNDAPSDEKLSGRSTTKTPSKRAKHIRPAEDGVQSIGQLTKGVA
jgi:putative transcriptional regulator